MDTITHKYADQGLVAYLIIIQDKLGLPPTSTFCQQWKSTNNPTMKLLIDPTGATGIYGPKETSLVINETGKIVFKAYGDKTKPLEDAIQLELATP